MASAQDFPARGKVSEVKNGKVVFLPANSNYEMYLETARPYDGPIGQQILAIIRAKARKVYTVPSGGGFVSPIFGPPRTIQGRALFVNDSTVVIRAGVPIIVELPAADDALDFEAGNLSVGSIVNAVALPGVTFELLQAATANAAAK
jgi:hypothetical protein